MNIKHLDHKLQQSFHFVQNDMITLQNRNYELLQRVERLERALIQRAFQPQQRQQQLQLIGNRETREVHTPDCLFARSMNFSHQIVFGSKQDALRAGFNECVCLY
ncbi:MAG: hypothetical protein AABX72_00285 [Nanoarchaeota archaeon]